MKLKRLAILAFISLLILGGLYFSFFRPSLEIIGHTEVAHPSEATPVIIHSTKSADAPSPLPHEKPLANPEFVKPESTNTRIQIDTTDSLGKQINHPTTPSIRSITADPKTTRPADVPAVQVAEDESARAPIGIRLAPDVRLPVAAMPNDLKLNPIKQKVLQQIIDEYYQTVAAASPATEETTMIEENGEETRVIANSPTVDAARKRADQRFKALFGHAAYNRMTMNTLLESRLPQNTPEQ